MRECNYTCKSELQSPMRLSRSITCIRRTQFGSVGYDLTNISLILSGLPDNLPSLSNLLESSCQPYPFNCPQHCRMVNPCRSPCCRIWSCSDYLYTLKPLLNQSRLGGQPPHHPYHYWNWLRGRCTICNVHLLRQRVSAIIERASPSYQWQLWGEYYR
jgi:hypothetical protein